MDMKLPGIVVTGASGFIGRHFLDAAAGEYRLFCLARRSQKEAGVPSHPNIRWTQVDIAEWDSLRDVVRCVKNHGGADYVLHLAGYYDFSNRPNPEYDHTNVRGTRNILKLAKQIGVKRFIFSSSLAACKFPAPGSSLTEESRPNAEFPYARSKRLGEEMILENAEWFPVTILRLAAIYSDWCEYPPVYKFLQTWLSRNWNAKILGGKGESSVTYLHINDLLKLIFMVIKKSKKLGRRTIYNASPDGSTSHIELFKIATRYFYGREISPLKMPKCLAAPGMAARQILGDLLGNPPFERCWMVRYIDKKLNIDSARTQRELGWQPTPRLHILRRLLLLIENMKTHSDVWHLRNEAAMQRVAQRPNLIIAGHLLDAREELVEKIFAFLTAPERKEEFAHYQLMDPESLKWYITFLHQLTVSVVRTRDRGLMRAYAQMIARRRSEEKFAVEEVCLAMASIGKIMRENLAANPELAQYSQRIYDLVDLTFQLAADEIADFFEIQNTSDDALPRLHKMVLPVENTDFERLIQQLEDICEDGPVT